MNVLSGGQFENQSSSSLPTVLNDRHEKAAEASEESSTKNSAASLPNSAVSGLTTKNKTTTNGQPKKKSKLHAHRSLTSFFTRTLSRKDDSGRTKAVHIHQSATDLRAQSNDVFSDETTSKNQSVHRSSSCRSPVAPDYVGEPPKNRVLSSTLSVPLKPVNGSETPSSISADIARTEARSKTPVGMTNSTNSGMIGLRIVPVPYAGIRESPARSDMSSSSTTSPVENSGQRCATSATVNSASTEFSLDGLSIDLTEGDSVDSTFSPTAGQGNGHQSPGSVLSSDADKPKKTVIDVQYVHVIRMWPVFT